MQEQYTPDEFDSAAAEREKRIDRIKKECDSVKWVLTGVDVPMEWHDDPKGGSYWEFDTEKHGPHGKVFLTSTLLDEEDGVAQAIAGHEMGHVTIDRPLDMFTEEERQTLGFFIGYNWAGDNAVEHFFVGAHSKGRAWMKVRADVAMAPGGGLDHTHVKKAKEQVGYIPKHMLLGGMMRQYYLKREITGDLHKNNIAGEAGELDPQKLAEFIDDEHYPDEVREVFRKIQQEGLIEKVYQTIPDPFPTEERVQEVAQQRADAYREIWAHYQELVEQSKQEQSLIDFIDKLIEKSKEGGGMPGSAGGQTIVIDLDSFPEDIKEELKEKFGQGTSGGGSAGKSGKSGEAEESKAGESAGAGGASSSSSEGEPDQDASQKDGDGGSGSNASPIDELSEDAKEAVKQAYESLDPDEKQKIQEEAERELGGLEDDLNEEMQPNTNKEGATAKTNLGESKDAQDTDSSENGGEGGSGESGDSSDSKSEGEDQDGESSGSSSGSSGQSSSSSENPVDKSENDDSRSAQPSGSSSQRPYTPTRPTSADTRQALEEFEKQLEKSKPTSTNPESYVARALDPQDVSHRANMLDRLTATTPEIRDYADDFQNELWEAVRPDKQPNIRYSYNPGTLSIPRYLRGSLDGNFRFWKKEEKFKQSSVGITYLVDLSGSTADLAEDMTPARRQELDAAGPAEQWSATILGKQLAALIPMVTAQVRLQLRTEVHGFGITSSHRGRKTKTIETFVSAEELHELLGVQELPEDIKAALWSMIEDSGGSTPTADALIESFNQIMALEDENPRMRRDINFFVVFTDGQPNGGPNTCVAANQAILDHAKDSGKDVGIIYIGVGRGTEFVQDISVPLPEMVKVRIAEKLSIHRGEDVSIENVSTSFPDPQEVLIAYPIIAEAMITNPKSFAMELDEYDN